MKQPIDLNTLDSNKEKPDISWIGMRLLHVGNKKVYWIFGFAWDAERDQWLFLYQEYNKGGTTYARPLSHYHGCRENGEKRFRVV